MIDMINKLRISQQHLLELNDRDQGKDHQNENIRVFDDKSRQQQNQLTFASGTHQVEIVTSIPQDRRELVE